MLLALESATTVGSVAVGTAGRPVAEVAVGVSSRRAESLLPAVDFALRAAGMTPRSLTGVVVGGGPGSFTGVRIAGATAKALVHVLGIPLLSYSGLLALAAGVGAVDRTVCAVLDARGDRVFAACYRFPGFAAIDVISAPAARTIGDLLEEHGTRGSARSIFAGDGAARHQARIEAAGGIVAPVHLSVPRASALLWLAALDPEAGRVDDPGAWEPAYLRAWGEAGG